MNKEKKYKITKVHPLGKKAIKTLEYTDDISDFRRKMNERYGGVVRLSFTEMVDPVVTPEQHPRGWLDDIVRVVK